jgi:hypothetical protein
VLPELDLETGVRRGAGPATIRVTAAGTFGAEAFHHTRGRVGLGARWERGRLFADTNAAYGFPEHLARTELRGGYLTENGFVVSGALAATFGHGSGAVGRAPGRFGFELDLTKVVFVGREAGETGLFVSSGLDSDFSHTDWRGGLVFRRIHVGLEQRATTLTADVMSAATRAGRSSSGSGRFPYTFNVACGHAARKRSWSARENSAS